MLFSYFLICIICTYYSVNSEKKLDVDEGEKLRGTNVSSTVLKINIPIFRHRLQGFYAEIERSISSYMTISTWLITGKVNTTIVSLGRVPGDVHDQFPQFCFFIDRHGYLAFEDNQGKSGFKYRRKTTQTNIFIADNMWHHVAFVKNGTSGDFFIDGKKAGSIVASHDISYTNKIFCIAADCTDPTNEKYFFDGMFDRMEVYNKSLSYDDILKIYNEKTKEIAPAKDNENYQLFIDNIRKELSTKILHKHMLQHMLDIHYFPPNSLIMEFGVWMGSSINRIAAHNPHVVEIFGFDSFEGLPEDWSGPWVKGSFDMNGQMPAVRPNVKLFKGWFSDTIPLFKQYYAAKHGQPYCFHEEVDTSEKEGEEEDSLDINNNINDNNTHDIDNEEEDEGDEEEEEEVSRDEDTYEDMDMECVPELPQVALLHVDCDLYSSTKLLFDSFINEIRPGTIIVFDELLNFDGYETHEMKAFYEYVTEYNVSFEVLGIESLTSQPVAVKII